MSLYDSHYFLIPRLLLEAIHALVQAIRHRLKSPCDKPRKKKQKK